MKKIMIVFQIETNWLEKAVIEIRNITISYVVYLALKFFLTHIFFFEKFLDAEIQDISTSISIVDKLPKLKGGIMLMMKVTHM